MEFWLHYGVHYYKGCYPVFPPAIDCYSRQETEAPLTRKSWDWSLGFSQCALFLDCLEQMERGALDTPQFVFRHLTDNSLLFMLQWMWTWL
jgi:hypothetical protein